MKALELWYCIVKYMNYYHHKAIDEDIDIETCEGVPINIIEKSLKALEIIKEKEVNVFIFLYSGDLETYNDMVEDNRKLKQEEYELVKEVL